jgi:superfamily II DNA or RNA helicase
MLHRYSSRQTPLTSIVRELLHDASHYDRIAGYFSSSILEVAGEQLEAISWSVGDPPCVRILCNSELNPLDVATAKAAQWAIWQEWCRSLPELNDGAKIRLRRLHEFLSSGRMEVRVLPDESFGFVHGKAGVVRRADGSTCSFLGSANESKTAWQLNYEIVWLDDSPEGVAWVQAEFDALWSHPAARPLSEAVIADIQRLSHRTTFVSVTDWRKLAKPDPASAIVELPVYRRENGLWAHQKYFVRLAFDAHQKGGARYVLADQVGLGKTVQLGLVAKLIALTGSRPILICVPKTLMEQWQDELWSLLAFPSARWNGRQWIDERGVEHAELGPEGISRCPRRVGIVSSGLITSGSVAASRLLAFKYDCVIVDEAHRARRNSGTSKTVGYNNLMQFLRDISPKTTSLLLGTATPVQLDPLEAFDLLDALAQGDDRVLGKRFSFWRTQAETSINSVTEREDAPTSLNDTWPWMCNPFPPEEEGRDFARLRKALGLKSETPACDHDALQKIGVTDRKIVEKLATTFFREHNPYIRHIVRRTREYLEKTHDPATGEPFLKPVRVRLFGEGDSDALSLPPYLQDAYDAADAFCVELGKRSGLNAGFLKTILLRRIGSSIAAGMTTGEKMLGPDIATLDEEEDDEQAQPATSSLAPFSADERALLERFVTMLRENRMDDPKYSEVERALLQGLHDPEIGETGPWLERGCILFSQFYDTALWVAERLARRLPEESIGLYVGSGRSAILRGSTFERIERETIKRRVRTGEIRLVVGTDAASEGLNLQRLGTLINVDLPWNPTRLEQRKGRIQRIGQVRDEVYILNLRYRGSVEDRVHQLLASRQQTIHALFGQIPDTLEDVWVLVARHEEQNAQQRIDLVPKVHPFELRYERRPESVDFESCAKVLTADVQMDSLQSGWNS